MNTAEIIDKVKLYYKEKNKTEDEIHDYLLYFENIINAISCIDTSYFVKDNLGIVYHHKPLPIYIGPKGFEYSVTPEFWKFDWTDSNNYIEIRTHIDGFLDILKQLFFTENTGWYFETRSSYAPYKIHYISYIEIKEVLESIIETENVQKILDKLTYIVNKLTEDYNVGNIGSINMELFKQDALNKIKGFVEEYQDRRNTLIKTVNEFIEKPGWIQCIDIFPNEKSNDKPYSDYNKLYKPNLILKLYTSDTIYTDNNYNKHALYIFNVVFNGNKFDLTDRDIINKSYILQKGLALYGYGLGDTCDDIIKLNQFEFDQEKYIMTVKRLLESFTKYFIDKEKYLNELRDDKYNQQITISEFLSRLRNFNDYSMHIHPCNFRYLVDIEELTALNTKEKEDESNNI